MLLEDSKYNPSHFPPLSNTETIEGLEVNKSSSADLLHGSDSRQRYSDDSILLNKNMFSIVSNQEVECNHIDYLKYYKELSLKDLYLPIMKESNDITSLAPSAVKVYLNKSSK